MRVLFIGILMLFGHTTPNAAIEATAPSIEPKSLSFPPVQSINRQSFAASLGIKESLLEAYPEFEAFALANRLHRHMPYHGHRITTTGLGEPSLTYYGQQLPWSKVCERVAVSDEGLMTDHLYTHQGIVPGELGKCLPVFKMDQRYGERYILEVVSTRAARGLRSRQPHVWLRLCDTDGSLVSVGFFGERNIDGMWELIRHLYPRQGRVVSPDVYEVATLPREQVVTAIELTKDEYQSIYDFISDVQQDDSLSYQVIDTFFGTNCVGFAGKVLALLDIEVTGSRLNLPSVVTDWQLRIRHWRQEELARLKAAGELDPESEAEILYGLP